MARVEVNQLTKVFDVKGQEPIHALDNLSFSVSEGGRLVVTGPSGCGKTTLLRLIAGLDRPTRGDILLDGCSVVNTAPQDRNIAMVFQEPALYPHMTVFQNIGFGLQLRRCPSAEMRERVVWAAERLAISDCLSRMPTELSGGQRHRVAVARALVRRPRLFLFDEPLGNLDVPTREQMRGEILRACASVGAAAIYVTHDQLEAMILGDDIAVMNMGRLQQLGKPATVYAHPANVFVARFIGSPPMNLWEGTLLNGRTGILFQTAGWSLNLDNAIVDPLKPFCGKAVKMGIRPEDVRLSGEEETPGDLEATIDCVEDLGAEKRVLLLLSGLSFVARCGPGDAIEAPGKTRVRFTPSGLRFFDASTGKSIL